MTVTRTQLGTPAITTTATSITATLGSTATAQRLLVASVSSASAVGNLTLPAGWTTVGSILGASPNYVAVLARIADGSETGFTLGCPGGSNVMQVNVSEYTGLSHHGTAIGVQDIVATVSNASTNAPPSLGGGNALRSGVGLAVSVWAASAGTTSLSGFADSGWAVEAYGRAAGGWQATTLVAGSATPASQPTWTTARTNAAVVVVFSPPVKSRPRISFL